MANLTDGVQATAVAGEVEELFTITARSEKLGTISWTPGPHTQAHLQEAGQRGDLDELIDAIKQELETGAANVAAGICSYSNPILEVQIIDDIAEFVELVFGGEFEDDLPEEEGDEEK